MLLILKILKKIKVNFKNYIKSTSFFEIMCQDSLKSLQIVDFQKINHPPPNLQTILNLYRIIGICCDRAYKKGLGWIKDLHYGLKKFGCA